jgi:PIN domain nuclease of toxin-antitoxin system
MILLDTHVWVWWVHGDERLTASQLEINQANEKDVVGGVLRIKALAG